jgi:surface polysaccharide O-acyltransferase-like enzyme
MTKSSLALSNLRAVVILLVVAFHSVLAYLGSQPASPPPFDAPPYHWKAFPILDEERWFGFDLWFLWQLLALNIVTAGLFWLAPRSGELLGRLYAYGIYLVHYVFVVWLQYLLLGVALFAIAKAAIVFTATVVLSWVTAAAVCRIPIGARVVGADRRVLV